MTVSSMELVVALLGLMCVIVVCAIFITRLPPFIAIINKTATLRNKIVLMLLFGIISIYGTIGGVNFETAIVNVRDIGPLAGGMFCGPIVGIGAGIIGAAYRFTVGGVSTIPCTIATLLCGIVGSLVYIYYTKKQKFAGITTAVIIAVIMEIIHMALLIVIIKPIDLAINIVATIGPAMIIANAVGIYIFAYLISTVIKEKSVEGERDNYQKELMKRTAELEIASKIQADFLPKNIPKISGLDIYAKAMPAKEIGGDFYDIIPLLDHKFGLVIADVSGKSVPAALFMAVCRTIMRATALHEDDICTSMHDANNLVSENTQSGMFVTLFYGIFNEKDNTFTYANCGHNPPMLLKKDNSDFMTLLPTGISLGIKSNALFKKDTVTINYGDILLCYTDGITEAQDENENLFGEERVMDIIRQNRDKSSEVIANMIISAVQDYSGGREQFDDITMILIKGV